MANGMHRLTEVNVGCCAGVSDLTALARIRSLDTLDVSGCAVGDDELVALAGELPALSRYFRLLRLILSPFSLLSLRGRRACASRWQPN
jgi:hypothetical protein